jgi:glycolate oxidase iron-sulfur subunit
MQPNLVDSIQTQASQCVKCGLCLPYCPTYGLTQNENESPRGRIALMHNLATEALVFSPKAHDHIDNCLSCKECERVCPAGVPYESLLLNYRAWEKPKISAPLNSTRFLEYIVSYPIRTKTLAKILWVTQK